MSRSYDQSTATSKTRPPDRGGRPVPEPGGAGRGSRALQLSLGVETAAGIWLIVATAAFGPSLGLAPTGPAWNEFACGVAVAVVAWIRLSAPHGAPWAGLLTIGIGAWLIAASLVFGRPAAGHPAFSRLNELITGIVITIFALVTVGLALRLKSAVRHD
ncbi:SPW repeat domain-containing protein [Amycolatopsis tolypomycina]|uniref:SPW repeat domain-containing protein n=1 Tax=Amycolatopsis tolypomycina TaxID=208445 RepID=UPI0033ADE351